MQRDITGSANRTFTRLPVFIIGMMFASTIFTYAHAANWYVRPNGGSYGVANGTDWNNAFNGFTNISWVSIRPGDIIWLAGGTYTQSLAVQAAGTSVNQINIKRATITAHGTDTGWSNVFDSQVLLSNGATIRFPNFHGADYVTVDGVVRDGIRVDYLDGSTGVRFGAGHSYVTLKNIKLAGPGKDKFQNNGTTGVYIAAWNGTNYDVVDHLTISYCDISNSDTLIQSLKTDYITVEYSILHDAGCANPQTWHPNSYYVGSGCNYGTFRYNILYNINAEGLFFTDGGQTGWKIYGNVFYDCIGSGRGIEWHQCCTYGTFEVYNNTFVDLNCYAGIAPRGVVSGSVYNNIFYNSPASFSSMSHNNNAFSGSNSESNGISNMPSGAFVNYSGKDFHIVSAVGTTYPRNKGITSSSYYNTDMDGVMRGGDGAWDIGAYEYNSSSNPPPQNRTPAPPSSLQLR